eukprot:gnl/MRDRNA2_/MRDRNA2_464298_c0_seq1.p1 gnl/MRDRNA2_/MRDRNA2_464298_c0~~gnl/MRDRNA2_/MRDRNA2_464298_c0_seq1.p1  ORF type:complete len:116 (+),score=26.43 gnl/MRDRNA2_/MRDRNA2_464298_c0_seq1:83-430(+)
MSKQRHTQLETWLFGYSRTNGEGEARFALEQARHQSSRSLKASSEVNDSLATVHEADDAAGNKESKENDAMGWWDNLSRTWMLRDTGLMESKLILNHQRAQVHKAVWHCGRLQQL